MPLLKTTLQGPYFAIRLLIRLISFFSPYFSLKYSVNAERTIKKDAITESTLTPQQINRAGVKFSRNPMAKQGQDADQQNQEYDPLIAKHDPVKQQGLRIGSGSQPDKGSDRKQDKCDY